MTTSTKTSNGSHFSCPITTSADNLKGTFSQSASPAPFWCHDRHEVHLCRGTEREGRHCLVRRPAAATASLLPASLLSSLSPSSRLPTVA